MPIEGAKNLGARVGLAWGATRADLVSRSPSDVLSKFLRTLTLSCSSSRWHCGASRRDFALGIGCYWRVRSLA